MANIAVRTFSLFCFTFLLLGDLQECRAKTAVLVSSEETLVNEVKRFAEEKDLLVVETNELSSRRRKRHGHKPPDVCETVWMEYVKKLGDVANQQQKLDDIQNRIAKLKEAIELEKIDTCREYIGGFGDPVKVDERSSLMGTFMNDLAPGRDEIWVSDGCCEMSKLYEFKTLSDFQNDKVFRTHQLDTPCDGTGHVIYDAKLYCNKKNSNTLLKFDLRTRNDTIERSLPNAGYRNRFPYQFYAYSDIDFAIDEQGLWVIYSTPQNNGNMVVSRLGFNNLTVLSTFETNFKKNHVGNAFMACGVLYATSSYVDSPTYIVYMYDTNDGTEKFLNENAMKLRVNDYGNGRTSTFMLDYNPKDRKLYAWTYYNQITYQVLRNF